MSETGPNFFEPQPEIQDRRDALKLGFNSCPFAGHGSLLGIIGIVLLPHESGGQKIDWYEWIMDCGKSTGEAVQQKKLFLRNEPN